jgi:triacylglycerol lipase
MLSIMDAMSPLRFALEERLIQTEAFAILHEVALVPWNLAPIVPDLEGVNDVVILLHGLLASAGVFRPMRARLEAQGYCAASFSYAPNRSIRTVAERLIRIVSIIPERVRVHLLGHSLGGIVARDYVQNLGGHERVVQTVSLASPFYGVPYARRFPWVVRDLRPGSALLERIRACPPHVKVPHLSIIAGRDRMVPPENTRLPGAPHVVLPHSGHNTLLFDPEVIQILLDQLKTSGRVSA